jgi:hypothetical protein
MYRSYVYILNYAQCCMIRCNNSTTKGYTIERIHMIVKRTNDRINKYEILI